MFSKNFADDWIRTADLWCRKQPICQLSHNNYPKKHLPAKEKIEWLNAIVVSSAVFFRGSNIVLDLVFALFCFEEIFLTFKKD